MCRRVAIIQSNYIPWKGYFDIINAADEFVLYDTAQYTKNDWRNRNRIKTSNGLLWLTIPVLRRSLDQRICETFAVDNHWRRKHVLAIRQAYSKSTFFRQNMEFLESLYCNSQERSLSRINFLFISGLCQALGIATRLHWSMDFDLPDGRVEKLVQICKKLRATTYLSGPSAKCYLDEKLFEHEGIAVEYFDYSGYPAYRQSFPPFQHDVSVIDLLFNEGPKAPVFMKSFKHEVSGTQATKERAG